MVSKDYLGFSGVSLCDRTIKQRDKSGDCDSSCFVFAWESLCN